jgi:HJR/Mrr/RecB family endonuclease
MPGEEALGRELFDALGASPEGGTTTMASLPLSQEDVRRLSPQHFEGLVAALETQQGAYVLLTPYAADGGIDIIAVQSQAVRLIQCKHTRWDTRVDAEVIAEVIAAFDGYRARWLATLTPLRLLRPVIVTNGEFTRQAQKAAVEYGIELIAARQLWRLLAAAPCTHTDILTLEARRLASMCELPEALRRIWAASTS